MRQRVSAESTTQSSHPKGLHPVLQHALNHLHVQLDEELTRYRRQKRLGTLPREASYRTAKPLESLSLNPTGESVKPSPSPQRQPDGVETPCPGGPYLTPSSPLEPLDPPPSASPPIAPLSPSLMAAIPGALAKVRTANGESGQNGGLVTGKQPYDPYDYLESSEELLRSLSEEEGQVGSPKENPASRWPLPLIMGSLLLILLSSATLGFLLVSQQFNASKQSPQPSQTNTARNPNTPSTSGPSTSGTSLLPPQNPDLTTKEFPDLNLNTLGTIPKNSVASPVPSKGAVPGSPKPEIGPSGASQPSAQTGPQSTSTAASAPILPPRPSRSVEGTVPAPALTPVPKVRVQPAAPLPQVAPATSMPAPVRPVPQRPAATTPSTSGTSSSSGATRTSPPPKPTASPQDYYYVISNYDSDRTLQEAQKSVPGAYVRNFSDGARIQMGAFSDAEKARKLAEELKQQGISAEVYQP